MKEDEFTFIEEQVNNKKSKKIVQSIKRLGITVIMAALFGAISALSFYYVYGIVTKDENKVPMPTYTAENRDSDSTVYTTAPTDKPRQKEDNDRIAAYERKYKNIAEFCAEQNNMLVMVSEIEDGINYFENNVENVNSYSGIIISKDDKNIYVLTQGNAAGRQFDYKITLNDKTMLDAVYRASDTSTGLMVLSADISDMAQDKKKGIQTAKIGKSSSLKKGDAIFAVGAPQGDMYSIAYGYICSDMVKKYLPDRSVSIFNTNVHFKSNATGYIMNSDEEVIGIISNSFFESDSETGCFLGITSLQGLINQLISGKDRAAAGIILQDITKEYLDMHGLENGVYIQDINSESEVLQAGLSVGDIIISVNEKKIKSVEEYTAILENLNVGEEISIDIYREHVQDEDKYKTITVELGKDS